MLFRSIKRKEQLLAIYKKDQDIQLIYRLREIELMIKRYKRRIQAEVDASGMRPELEQLAEVLNA